VNKNLIAKGAKGSIAMIFTYTAHFIADHLKNIKHFFLAHILREEITKNA